MQLNIVKVNKELKRMSWGKRDLAKRMKKHRQWMYELLKPGHNPTFKTISALAKALDVDPRDLIK